MFLVSTVRIIKPVFMAGLDQPGDEQTVPNQVAALCNQNDADHVTHPKSSSSDLKKNLTFCLFSTCLKSARVTRCAGTLILIRYGVSWSSRW